MQVEKIAISPRSAWPSMVAIIHAAQDERRVERARYGAKRTVARARTSEKMAAKRSMRPIAWSFALEHRTYMSAPATRATIVSDATIWCRAPKIAPGPGATLMSALAIDPRIALPIAL